MKTTKRINAVLLTAVAAFSLLTSCTKENNTGTDPDGMTMVKFRISYGPETRAVGTALNTGDKPTFRPGHIFFTDGTGKIVRQVNIVDGVAASGEVALTDVTADEAVILAVPAAVQKCYILSNDTNAKLGGTSGVTTDFTNQNISVVRALTAAVPDLNDAAGADTNVPLFGEGPLVPVGGMTTGNGTKYDASVDVPIYTLASRMQIKKLTGAVYNYTDASAAAQTVTIDEFVVEGIYINNYYPQMAVNGTYPASIVDNGQDAALYTTTGTAPYSATGSGYRLSDSPSPSLTSTADAPNQIAAPGTSTQAWAYNLFPTPAGAATNAAVPHIVIKFSSVKVTDSAGGGQKTLTNQFITIKSIRATSGGAAVNVFEPNNIYTFSNIQFNFTHLSPLPEADDIDVLVTVDVQSWTNNEVEWAL